MAQLLVRNLDDGVKLRLRDLAKKHGRSMEEEAREILRQALCEQSASSTQLGTEIAVLFRGHGLTEEIQELRGQTVRPISFEP